MKYNITEKDKLLLLQNDIRYKTRLFVLNRNKQIIDELEGISSFGSYSIDASSSIRRTLSFVLELDSTYSSKHIEEKLEVWIGYDFQVQIGLYDIRNEEYNWYECGTYTITSSNTSYDESSNTLSTELNDWFSKLDGTRNGQIGGVPTIVIPVTDEDNHPVTIKGAAIGVLKDNGITDYIIQDLGEFYGLPEYNADYLAYRTAYPNWNQLPYELSFHAGCTVSDILTELRDLYPNCEMYYDLYNTFCFHMIPSCEHDPVTIDNAFLQQIIVAENSESVTYHISDMKNITEVFGKVYSVDRYCEAATYTSNVYNLTLDSYQSYQNGEIIAFTAPLSSLPAQKLRINTLASIPIYREGKTEYIAEGTMEANKLYCVKITYRNNEFAADFLGTYQPHALCVLTNDENDPFYTKDYFSQKYNCSNIVFRVEKENPFAVQRLGEILDVKSGNEFDHILSDSVAVENALYYNKNSSSLNDIVTLTTAMIPWLDVNVKVSYQKQQESEPHDYIVKSVSNDFSNGTSTITLHRFYPFYFKLL